MASRRGRPRRVRAVVDQTHETRERILRVALDVFAERGYAGASTREVCERAGVNPAALNYHWGTKERLWIAVCEHCSQLTMKIVGEAADFSLPMRELVPRFLSRMFDELAKRPAPARIPLWASLQSSALDFSTTSTSLFEPLASMSMMMFMQAQARGEIPREIDLQVVVPLIYGQLLFAFADPAGHRLHYGTDLTDEAHAKRVKKAFIEGVGRMLGWTDITT